MSKFTSLSNTSVSSINLFLNYSQTRQRIRTVDLCIFIDIYSCIPTSSRMEACQLKFFTFVTNPNFSIIQATISNKSTMYQKTTLLTSYSISYTSSITSVKPSHPNSFLISLRKRKINTICLGGGGGQNVAIKMFKNRLLLLSVSTLLSLVCSLLFKYT